MPWLEQTAGSDMIVSHDCVTNGTAIKNKKIKTLSYTDAIFLEISGGPIVLLQSDNWGRDLSVLPQLWAYFLR